MSVEEGTGATAKEGSVGMNEAAARRVDWLRTPLGGSYSNQVPCNEGLEKLE